MPEATRTAIEACVEALNTEYTPEKSERANRRPHPAPDRPAGHASVGLDPDVTRPDAGVPDASPKAIRSTSGRTKRADRRHGDDERTSG